MAQKHEIEYVLRIKDQITVALGKIKTAVKGSERAIKVAMSTASSSSSKAQNKIVANWQRIASTISSAGSKISASVKTFTGKFKSAIDNSGVLTNRFVALGLKFGPLVAGIVAVAGAVKLLTKAFTSAVREGAEFQQSMATLKAITKPTEDGFKRLSKQARLLGKETAFSASESARAFTELGKMGFSVDEIINSSRAVLDLASATQEQMPVVATAVASTIRQFGLSADESRRVADVMSSSFNQSSLDLSKFADSMKFAGPVANSLGVSLERTSGMLAVLSNNAISGSMAGTSLRRILLVLGDESSKVSKRLQSMGIDSVAPLTDKLHALAEANLTSAERTEYFGLRASTSALVLLKNVDSIDAYTTALSNAGGTTERMAKVQLATVIGSFKIFKSALSEVKLLLFDTFSSDLQKSIVNATSNMDYLMNSIKFNKKNLQSFARGIIWIGEKLMTLGEIALDVANALGGLYNNWKRFKLGASVSSDDVKTLKTSIKIMQGSAESYTKHKEILRQTEDAYNKLYDAIGRDIDSGSFDKLTQDEKDDLDRQLSHMEFVIDKEKKLMKDKADTFEKYSKKVVAIDSSQAEEIDKTRKRVFAKKEPSLKSSTKLSKGFSAVDEQNITDVLSNLSTSSGGEKTSKKEAEIKRAGKLAETIRIKLKNVNLSADQKEVASIVRKYEAQRVLLEKHHLDTTANAQLEVAELEAFNKDKLKSAQELTDKALAYEKQAKTQERLLDLESQGSFEEAELLRLQEKYDKKLALAKKYGADATNLLHSKELEEARIHDKFNAKREQQERALFSSRMKSAQTFYNGIGDLIIAVQGKNKESAKIAQGIAVGKAIMDTYVGANLALSSSPPPFNFIAMAGVIASGLANVVKISSQKFANGGIVQGGYTSGDRISVMANAGEMILNKKQQARLYSIAQGRSSVNNNNSSSTNITSGDVNITISSGSDFSTADLTDAVSEVLYNRNVDLARMLRTNEEFGVTA